MVENKFVSLQEDYSWHCQVKLMGTYRLQLGC